MNCKTFSQRFNRELTLSGFPEKPSEKTAAIVKVFKVKRHLANGMIFGELLPSEEQLDNIAAILEVCPKWLGGKTDKKKGYSNRDAMA
ncbi:MAG TPA: hypothetical protein DCG13_00520 [Legionellales bacterium]|nr:hypothetical protein [Legionellales bacterium]HCA89021.1 hypothetical protein [Legionellales bacterium]|tara:strand:- start:891 stop:1154 length:264 start_codon:yes stop_codon:yes gene_type:complete